MPNTLTAREYKLLLNTEKFSGSRSQLSRALPRYRSNANWLPNPADPKSAVSMPKLTALSALEFFKPLQTRLFEGDWLNLDEASKTKLALPK